MKKYFLILLTCFISVSIFAQIQNPVQWTYATAKKSDKVYQITITASLPKSWHIYSQTTPKGGPVPTKITFNKNPLVTISGIPNEVGALKVEHDKNFGIDVKYFSDKVDFVQTVNLKANVKTTLSGNVEYMVCNDAECLPPVKKTFEVKLQ